MRDTRGITLVVLVVTIIVLLILAGVTISLSVGDNGIFSKARIAEEKHKEALARERLELLLSNIVLDKNIKKIDEEYIDKELAKDGMVVIGNIVIVDGWQFQIDKSIPKIVMNIGKGNENNNILIETNIQLSKDYTNAVINIKVTNKEGNINEIIVNGERKTVPIPLDGIHIIEDIVSENGEYIILAKDENENYKIKKVEIEGITEDIQIWNKADIEEFRDKVNEGRTFEGKKIYVKDNINLEGTQSNQWTPIGSKDTPFKGTFEGNGYTIENIYLTKADCKESGLFGVAKEANIQNVNVTGKIETNNFGAGIVAVAEKNCKIFNCKNYVSITQKGNSYFVEGYPSGDGTSASGISAFAYDGCEFKKCINYGNIVSNVQTGGIVGHTNRNITIDSCGNEGNISGGTSTAGIIARIGIDLEEEKEQYTINIQNCYNRGNITATRIIDTPFPGGICGCIMRGEEVIINNCYNMGNIEANETLPTNLGVGGILGGIGNWSMQAYATITNSYSIGNISCTNVNGISLGKILGADAGNGRRNLKNLYYLNTSIGGDNRYGGVEQTAEKLQGLDKILGENFTKDSNNINKGYPILKWEER